MTYIAQELLSHSEVVFKHNGIKLVQTCAHHFIAKPDITFFEQSTIVMHSILAVTRSHRNVEIHQEALLWGKCVLKIL